MGNAAKAFNALKATGLTHVKVTIQLYSKGIRGQHKAVDETLTAINSFAATLSKQHVKNFTCTPVRQGDNYILTIEYDGFYNSQVFTSEVWKRLSPYFVLNNV